MVKKERNSALDLIRITALFSVVSIHFFWNNGFYAQPVQGKRMYVMTLMVVAFRVCVPLFMILTGYLMNKKTLSVKYYSGIVKTLAIYVLASAACILYDHMSGKHVYTLKSAVAGVLDFTGASYSWYIEMYIGLFLLIPFANVLYWNLESKKQKQILILTFVFVGSAYTIFNIYNFSSLDWWRNPASSNAYQKIVPAWWTRIYPLTYYFIGCYIREYHTSLKKTRLAALLLACVAVLGSFSYYRSRGVGFLRGSWQGWDAIPTMILAVLVFLFLLNLPCERLPGRFRRFLGTVSDLCLGAYLVSYIFDSLFYPKLIAAVPDMPRRLEYYVLIVPAVFLCSLVLSALLNFLYRIPQILRGFSGRAGR